MGLEPLSFSFWEIQPLLLEISVHLAWIQLLSGLPTLEIDLLFL